MRNPALRRIITVLGLGALLVSTLGVAGPSTPLSGHDHDHGGGNGSDDPFDMPVLPSPAFTELVAGEPCTADNPYEARIYGIEEGDLIYDEGCERMKLAFGPLLVKPGENDALIEPVTIEQPRYNGYITRFKPDLLRAATGEPPPTDHLHLHHATWLDFGNNYGNSIAFFAAGEEKTIATFPHGYGMEVGRWDMWGLLYMIHSDHPDPDVVWLTYEIDFIDKQTAEQVHDMVNVRPIWLDVQGRPIHPDAPNRSSNPIFNVHKGFGGIDPESGRQVCVWPKENCARFDYYEEVNPHQGDPGPNEDPDKYDIPGADWTVTSGFEGTLIGGGGHLHPGGIRTELSLVRDGEEKPIHISDAIYWDWDDPEKVGGKPHSWNLSMTVQGAGEGGWKVKIREGDILRLNAVYDSQDASWYAGMGIKVMYVAPDDPHEPPGVDVFEDDVILDRGVVKGAKIPDGPYDAATGWRPHVCDPDEPGPNGEQRLCLRGQPTHGALPESQNHDGGCRNPDDCPEIDAPEGPIVSDLISVGFTYLNADIGAVRQTGIPRVVKGETVRMWNFDSPANIPHSFTRCAYPCTGPSAMHYPIPDGGSGDPWDWMDFESGELGYGTMFDQTKSQPVTGGGNKGPMDWVRDGLWWEFEPSETGTFTFFCRIHRGMRGVFEVIEPED
jgi:hypothetical protein